MNYNFIYRGPRKGNEHLQDAKITERNPELIKKKFRELGYFYNDRLPDQMIQLMAENQVKLFSQDHFRIVVSDLKRRVQ